MFEDATGLETVNFGEGTLTVIPDRFFKGCTSLVSPSTYTGISSVGTSAFEGCAAMTELSFDEALTSVGGKAFQDCAALTRIILPDSLTEIGALAFKNDASLAAFHMPESLLEVPVSAFSGCTALNTVEWNQSLKVIHANAFENTALTTVEFPASLTGIDAYAFSGAKELSRAVFPEGLTSIGSCAFASAGMTSVELPESLTTLGNGAWMNCASLSTVQLNAGLKMLPMNTFEGCASLSEVVLPEGMTEIGARALAGCSSLTNVVLPRSLRVIGGATFENCTALTQLLIWPDVTEIAADAFTGCKELTIQGWNGSAAQLAATAQGLPFSAQDQALAYRLNATEDGYLVSGCDSNAVVLILPAEHEEMPVTGIVSDAFADCAYLREVSVEEGSSGFAVENGVLLNAARTTLLLYPARRADTGFTVGSTITEIGDYAFAHCANLRTLTIGDQVQTIGEHAFASVNEGLCLLVTDGSYAQLWASAHGVPFASAATMFTYRVENEKAYVTGYTGTLSEIVVPASIDGCEIYAIENLRNSMLTRVTVSEGIVEIGEGAFQGDSSSLLERVILPGSIRIISRFSFAGQTHLKEIALGGTTEIGASAFQGCESLTEIDLPDSLLVIGNRAFESSGLTSLTIPANVTSIGDSFLDSCSAFTTLRVAQGNVSYTFENGLLYENAAQALVYSDPALVGAITVREGTVSIAGSVFRGRGITAVTLPDSLKKIGDQAFRDCRQLMTVNLPEGLTAIGDSAFGYCTLLENVVLPETLTSLGDSAFQCCMSLTEMTVPDGVTYLYSTFRACYSLRSLTLPEGLKGMYNGVTESCRVLENLHLPSTLETLDTLPSSLKTVTTAPGSVRYVSEEGILYDTNENAILFVNASVGGSITIREGITAIGANAFAGKTALMSIALPESCTSIGNEAFSGCTALTEVGFPDGLKSIGAHAFENTGLTTLTLSQPGLCIHSFAFSGCSALTSVDITSTESIVMEYAFANCEHLERASFPEEVVRFEGGCFAGCTSLTTVKLPNNLTALHGFEDCTSLTEIEIPASVTKVQANAFKNCGKLTAITLPEGVTSIGENAFAGCSELRTFNFPDSLTSIGAYAFRGTALTDVVIPEKVSEIPKWAFEGISSLRSVSIRSNLTSIGDAAFYGAAQLTTIDLPESLTAIGSEAFRESGLTAVSVPGSVTVVGNMAFYGCEALESISVAPGVERIGDNAFENCVKISEVELPASVGSVGESAFGGCTTLKMVSMSAKQIGAFAFRGCTVLETVNTSVQLEEIPGYAFNGCVRLTRISENETQKGAYLAGAKRIGEWAFQGCGALTSVTFGDVLETIGEYAFDSTNIRVFQFPDSVTEIGGNAIWRNYSITSVHLPAGLKEIARSMFSCATRLEMLTLPESLRTIGYQAFKGNVSLGALKLPEGIETIGAEAFSGAMLKLEIPASVTAIAEDAFDDAIVEFYTPEGSAAHQYALNHGIPVHVNETLSAADTADTGSIAASIVSSVVTADMTDYQKAEALVDWMLANVQLDDMLPSTHASRQVLVFRKGSRWGWAFAYKALLNAANITNAMYFNAKGVVEGASVGSGAVSVSYFDGDAVNMIQIDGQWYFTHPAFVDYYGKTRYFMLNRDVYRLSFGDDPNVEGCDSYDQTYLYQAYSKDIETGIVEQASASFAEGNKLVYAEVPSNEEIAVPYYERAVDYAGQHMDTLEWNNAEGTFEPVIINMGDGYWLSDDLTGEQAEVTLDEGTVYLYGTEMQADPAYTAVLCGLNVEGTLSLTEEEADAQTIMLMSMPEVDMVDVQAEKHAIVGQKVYRAVFTPMLSQYIDTLAPTEFSLVVDCQLPSLTDNYELDGNRLILKLAEGHVFPENAQLDLVILPVGASSEEAVHIRVADSVELYPDGRREILVPLDGLSCDRCYSLSIAQMADGCLNSPLRYLTDEFRGAHRPMISSATPADASQDGEIGKAICAVCASYLHDPTPVNHERVLWLHVGVQGIEEEAFMGLPMEQVVLPEGIVSIAGKAFADCEQLKIVVVPESLQSMADDVFSGSHPVLCCDAENQAILEWAAAHGLSVVVLEEREILQTEK